MKKWHFKSVPVELIEDLPSPEALFGFVYKITNELTGKIYIGKKTFYANRKKPLPKKERSADKRRVTYKRVRVESDWLIYRSSCDLLRADIEKYGEQAFCREILGLSCSSKYLNYLELKYMILNNILEKDSYNGNIAGKYYAKDLQSNCFQS